MVTPKKFRCEPHGCNCRIPVTMLAKEKCIVKEVAVSNFHLQLDKMLSYSISVETFWVRGPK